jgi:thymidylate synthase (FAD)
MSNVKMIWSTPDIDNVLAYIARVSNPDNQDNPNIKGLLTYMMTHGHVSPFEMANVCLELNTTRDIGRQVLRHKSLNFQEFSGRYQDMTKLDNAPLRECRLQDTKNRQNSVLTEDADYTSWWEEAQRVVRFHAQGLYDEALSLGIAKEQARALLPEGLTMSRMYANGNLRSWIFYLKQRLDPTTQKEHRELAQQVLAELRLVAPVTMEAFFPLQNNHNKGTQ